MTLTSQPQHIDDAASAPPPMPSREVRGNASTTPGDNSNSMQVAEGIDALPGGGLLAINTSGGLLAVANDGDLLDDDAGDDLLGDLDGDSGHGLLPPLRQVVSVGPVVGGGIDGASRRRGSGGGIDGAYHGASRRRSGGGRRSGGAMTLQATCLLAAGEEGGLGGTGLGMTSLRRATTAPVGARRSGIKGLADGLRSGRLQITTVNQADGSETELGMTSLRRGTSAVPQGSEMGLGMTSLRRGTTAPGGPRTLHKFRHAVAPGREDAAKDNNDQALDSTYRTTSLRRATTAPGGPPRRSSGKGLASLRSGLKFGRSKGTDAGLDGSSRGRRPPRGSGPSGGLSSSFKSALPGFKSVDKALAAEVTAETGIDEGMNRRTPFLVSSESTRCSALRSGLEASNASIQSGGSLMGDDADETGPGELSRYTTR